MPLDSSATKPQIQSDTFTNTASQMEFESWLYSWAEFIRREQWKTRKLVEMSVTLHRRDRGLTLSDMCGRYGIRPSTEGYWLDYNQDLDGEIHPINIVTPAITTNTNACLQSNAEVEVKSANASALHKQIAMKWEKVSDYFERIDWDEVSRTFIFDAAQKDGTVLIETVITKGEKTTVPRVGDGGIALAVYNCEQCGPGVTQTDAKPMEHAEPDADDMGGMPDGDADDAYEAEVDCPKCQSKVPAMVKRMGGESLSEAAIETKKITSEIVPFYNFAIDTYNAKIKGIKGAKWLQKQTLWDRMKLESKYNRLSFPGSSLWSYPICVDYALANADWGYLNQQLRNSGFSQFDMFEVREIYLHEEAYENYRAPSDFEFINGKGEKCFTIKKGQTIGEAQEAMYGADQHGFKFVWNDQWLLDIVGPEMEEINFRERFTDIHWDRKSGSYLSSPNYSIVYIQDDITILNTMDHNIIARNAVVPVYYNSLVFDKGDFSQEYIGSKNAGLLPDADMTKTAFSLPIPTPSPYLQNKIGFLWQVKDTVSQVTPAMRGEEQKGAPYAAQRQQLEQSYGSLTAVLKSFAQCKVETFRNKARLASKHWTLEQFQRVGSMFGEIWTEEDIDEMCNIDFDADLIITYRQGSEMPSTAMTKELKFYGALQQLIPLITANGQPLDQNAMQQIMKKIDENGEFDFDLTGLEVNELIAQKRYIDLATICKQYEDVTFEEIQQMQETVVSVEPPDDATMQQAIALAQSAPDDPNAAAQAKQMVAGTPITALDLMTERIFAESGIRFSQYEDLPSEAQFFVEMLRAEIGKTKPNEVLRMSLEALLGMMTQMIDQMEQEAMAKSPEAMAAKVAADAEAETAGQDREDTKQLEAKNSEDAQKDKEADRELKREEMANKKESETQAQTVDLIKTVAGHEAAAEQAERSEKGKAKESKKK